MIKVYILFVLAALELAGFALVPDSPHASVYSAPRYSCTRRVEYQYVPCWSYRWESKA